MKRPTQPRTFAVKLMALAAALAALGTTSQAQVTFEQVTNGLVTYYPMDAVSEDGTTTPDVISGRDMILYGMDAGNIIPSDRPSDNTASVSNCFNFDQVGGPTATYYNSTGQNPLDLRGPDSDFLPFCNQRGATMNFWIKGDALGTDTRFFGECDTSGANANPLYLWGDHGSSPGAAHLLFRQQDATGTNGSSILTDGTYQLPGGNNIGYYMEQGGTYTTNAVLDGTWHMFTVTCDENGYGSVFIDGVLDPGIGTWTDSNGNPSALRQVPVTNEYYAVNEYPYVSPPASNPPPNGYVAWVLNGIHNSGSTCFGGFKRGGVSGGVPCQIDDIGFWDRVLSSNEIMFVMTNGLPGLEPNPDAIRLISFTADFGEVGLGDTVALNWNIKGVDTSPGSIVISGVGDVSALGLIGSTNVTLSADQDYTFTLTAHNGIVPDETASVSVKTFPGVSSDWHLIQRFDGLFSDTSQGINSDGWVSAKSDYTGVPRDRWNVLTFGGNKILTPRSGYAADVNSFTGFESRGALAYGQLNGLTIPPGQTNTLFFRFAIQDSGIDYGGGIVLYSDLDCNFGVTDTPQFVGPFGGLGYGGNVGPYFSILRNSGGAFVGPDGVTPVPFDLFAHDLDESTGQYTNTFSYIASVDTNGLQTNVDYYVWMDIENYNTHAEVVGGTSNSVDQAQYSVWLQKEGETDRTLLFSHFHGNRDYVGYNPVNDFPTPYLDKVFVDIGDESLAAVAGGSYWGTNMVVVDDFYLSKSGLNSTIPIAAFRLTSIMRDASGVTISWSSLAPLLGAGGGAGTFTVERKFSLDDPTWTTLASGLTTTSYTDTTAGGSSSAYYRVGSP